MGNGEIARNKQFLFPTAFSILFENFLPFFIKMKIVVCKLFKFGSAKFYPLGRSWESLNPQADGEKPNFAISEVFWGKIIISISDSEDPISSCTFCTV